jgi:hypothetical protein
MLRERGRARLHGQSELLPEVVNALAQQLRSPTLFKLEQLKAGGTAGQFEQEGLQLQSAGTQ